MDIEDRKDKLTDQEKNVLLDGGTEAPFSGKYYKETRDGMYKCKLCGNELFGSDTKFHSDMPDLAGWPSFDDALPGSVEYVDDDTLGIRRTEVRCAKCHSHLGHIFDDHESKTGKHYCMNSVCLDFDEKK